MDFRIIENLFFIHAQFLFSASIFAIHLSKLDFLISMKVLNCMLTMYGYASLYFTILWQKF